MNHIDKVSKIILTHYRSIVFVFTWINFLTSLIESRVDSSTFNIPLIIFGIHSATLMFGGK